MNDNRNYHYGLLDKAARKEYPIISDWITPGSRVLDLGCGEGSLLSVLKKKGINGVGIDISKSGVVATRKKGIKAIVGRIDKKLPFNDNAFDFAICNVTIQMVTYPEILISEMIRISKKQIISFPNFGFILNRLEMLIFGRMPHIMLGGYQWYSTGHIHQLGIQDFLTYCILNNIKIIEKKYLYPKQFSILSPFIKGLLPDCFATLAIFKTSKK